MTTIMCSAHDDQCALMIIPQSVVLEMRNVSDKICREDQNTNFKSITSFSENRSVYQIMWVNLIQPDRP